MRAAGLAIAVQNARAEVKREAHYVTPHAGGDGALRDAVEFILKAQGRWKKVWRLISASTVHKRSQLSAVSSSASRPTIPARKPKKTHARERSALRATPRLSCLVFKLKSHELKAQQPKQKTHRMLAWGVLGSASDGLPFLLTHPVVFRSM
jgi:hypothetical protein